MDVKVIDSSKGLPRDSERDFTWWTMDKDRIHEGVFAAAKYIEERQRLIRQNNIRNYRLYHSSATVDLYANLYNVTSSRGNKKITMNVIKNVIDTLSSKIAKQRPRVLFLTEGGGYKTQKHARKLTKFMDGVFDELNHYQVKQDTFRDMLITGTGVTKFYIDWQAKCVKSERILPDELLVDDMDGLYGTPHTLYQRRFVNRQLLKKHFPDFSLEIENAKGPSMTIVRGFGKTGDLVEVIEGWRLPSYHEANDGVHVIAISNAALLVEQWEYDWFPFTFETYTKPSIGFWGTGVVHDIKPIQEEINEVLQRIQEALRLVAVPRVLVEASSRINKSALNNDIATIIEWQGSKPEFYTPQAMTPEVYNYLFELYRKCFELVGLSQFSATSTKPAGLNSGVAIREAQDIESERFQLIQQNREKSFLEDAKKIIALYTKIAEQDPKFEIRIVDENKFEQLRFKDLDLDLNKYILRTYPANLFPTQPAAKLQTVWEYTNLGLFDKDTAMELLDFPDVTGAITLETAPRRVIMKQLEGIIERGEYSPPEPFMPLEMAARLAQMFYLKCKLEGVDEDSLDLIRRYIEQCQIMIGMANQAQQQVLQAEQIIQQQQQMAQAQQTQGV
jgi:hypothetical protein